MEEARTKEGAFCNGVKLSGRGGSAACTERNTQLNLELVANAQCSRSSEHEFVNFLRQVSVPKCFLLHGLAASKCLGRAHEAMNLPRTASNYIYPEFRRGRCICFACG